MNPTVRKSRFSGRPRLTPTLLLFASLVLLQPASASTYTFTIPVGTQSNPNPNTLLWALGGALANDGFHHTTTQFAFYDFYVRPQIAADGCIVSGDRCNAGDPNGVNMNPVVGANAFNLITDYTMTSATAPVAGCVSPIASNCASAYTADANAIDPSQGGNAVEFRFSPTDNTIALVTGNANAGNQTYSAGANNPFPSGARTEIMPSSANLTFSFSTSAYSAVQTPAITFQIFALAIKYTAPGGVNLAGKDQAFVTNLDLVGSTPEPSTIFAAAGGLCLLALARFRRKTRR